MRPVTHSCASGLALLATVTAAFAEPIDIPFSPGAVTLDIVEVRTRTSTDQRGPTGAGRITAILAISGDDNARRGTWTTTSVQANGQTITANSPGAAELLIGFPMTMELGEDGAPVSIADWPALRARVLDTLTNLTPEAERTEQWRRGNEAARRVFESMSASDAARLLAGEVGILALCQHTSLPLNESLQSETMTPNPLGGPPIRTLVTYRLTNVDREAGRARISVSTALDPASATESIRQLMAQLSRETGRALPDDDESMDDFRLEQTTQTECDVDLATGIARSVTYLVSVRSGPANQRTDRRELTITPR